MANNNNNKRIVCIILSIILILFASFAADKLPKSANKYLENAWFKFLLFCSIAYLATFDLIASIIATIAVMMCYQSLSVYKITDQVIDQTNKLIYSLNSNSNNNTNNTNNNSNNNNSNNNNTNNNSKNIISKNFSSIKNGVENIGSDIKNKLGSVGSGIKNDIENVGSGIKNKIENIGSGIKNDISGVTKTIGNVKNTVVHAVKSPKQTITNIIKALRHVPNVIAQIIEDQQFIEQVKIISLTLAKALATSLEIITPKIASSVARMVEKTGRASFLALLDAAGVIPGVGEVLDLILVAQNILKIVFAFTNVGFEVTEMSALLITNLIRVYRQNAQQIKSTHGRITDNLSTFNKTTSNNTQKGGKRKNTKTKRKKIYNLYLSLF